MATASSPRTSPKFDRSRRIASARRDRSPAPHRPRQRRRRSGIPGAQSQRARTESRAPSLRVGRVRRRGEARIVLDHGPECHAFQLSHSPMLGPAGVGVTNNAVHGSTIARRCQPPAGTTPAQLPRSQTHRSLHRCRRADRRYRRRGTRARRRSGGAPGNPRSRRRRTPRPAFPTRARADRGRTRGQRRAARSPRRDRRPDAPRVRSRTRRRSWTEHELAAPRPEATRFVGIAIALAYGPGSPSISKRSPAVVHHGSFVRAATALIVTQPAVSDRIRHLERVVGTEVFERTACWRRPHRGRRTAPPLRRALHRGRDRGGRDDPRKVSTTRVFVVAVHSTFAPVCRPDGARCAGNTSASYRKFATPTPMKSRRWCSTVSPMSASRYRAPRGAACAAVSLPADPVHGFVAPTHALAETATGPRRTLDDADRDERLGRRCRRVPRTVTCPVVSPTGGSATAATTPLRSRSRAHHDHVAFVAESSATATLHVVGQLQRVGFGGFTRSERADRSRLSHGRRQRRGRAGDPACDAVTYSARIDASTSAVCASHDSASGASRFRRSSGSVLLGRRLNHQSPAVDRETVEPVLVDATRVLAGDPLDHRRADRRHGS